MFCPRCGVDNGGSAQFCEKCGFQLPVAAAPGAAYAVPQPAGGQPYGQPSFDDRRMRTAGQGADSLGRRYAQGKSPAVALILSFFLSGAGQLYNGDFKKCFLMWGMVVVIVVLAVATGGTAGFLGLGIWIWSMVDAYNVASRRSALW